MSVPAADARVAADEAVTHRILILDFGSQYTQLIARRVREAGVYSEILPWDVDETLIRNFAPDGVVLAGGPESVVYADPPRAPQIIFDLGVPLLGICYGMQTMAAQLGGEVEPSTEREFGYAAVAVTGSSRLLDGLHGAAVDDAAMNVWMSHGDRVTALPEGFVPVASSPNAPLAAMADDERCYYGLQFHPEVTHTENGQRIIERFVHDICGCPNAWNPGNIIARDIEKVRGGSGAG